jgi:hypothetical protein
MSQAPEDGRTNIRNMLSSKWWNNKASDIKLVYLYSNQCHLSHSTIINGLKTGREMNFTSALYHFPISILFIGVMNCRNRFIFTGRQPCPSVRPSCDINTEQTGSPQFVKLDISIAPLKVTVHIKICFFPEAGDSKLPINFCELLRDYTVSHSRRHNHKYSVSE